jgi:hypothetical protein
MQIDNVAYVLSSNWFFNKTISMDLSYHKSLTILINTPARRLSTEMKLFGCAYWKFGEVVLLNLAQNTISIDFVNYFVLFFNKKPVRLRPGFFLREGFIRLWLWISPFLLIISSRTLWFSFYLKVWKPFRYPLLLHYQYSEWYCLLVQYCTELNFHSDGFYFTP